MKKLLFIGVATLALPLAVMPASAHAWGCGNGGGFKLCFGFGWAPWQPCGPGGSCGPSFPAVDPALFGLPNGAGYTGYPPVNVYTAQPIYLNATHGVGIPAPTTSYIPSYRSIGNYPGNYYYPASGFYYPPANFGYGY